jgi:hypothetical protein
MRYRYLVAVALLATGCSTTTTVTKTVVPSGVTATAPMTSSCAYYAIDNPDGTVIVTVNGASQEQCNALGEALPLDAYTGWASTTLVGGTEIAQMTKDGLTLRIYQVGSTTALQALGRHLVDGLSQQGGWVPENPT